MATKAQKTAEVKNTPTSENAPGASAKQAPAQSSRQTRKATPYSRPVFNQTLHINNLYTQGIFERNFWRVARALFSIDVILPIIGQEEQVEQVEVIIQQDMQQMMEAVEAQTVGLTKIMDDNGIDEIPDYTHPQQYKVAITCPQVARFAQLMTRMDALLVKVDTVWLNGLMSSKERTAVNLEQRNKLNGLVGRLIQIESRAREAARAQGKVPELENIPTADEQTEAETVDA